MGLVFGAILSDRVLMLGKKDCPKADLYFWNASRAFGTRSEPWEKGQVAKLHRVYSLPTLYHVVGSDGRCDNQSHLQKEPPFHWRS